MNRVIHRCDQRSDEWFALRAGRFTASQAGDMLATVKSGEAAARRNLRTRLIVERLTGKPIPSTYQSKAMAQGVEREPLARAAYESLTGNLVEEIGFISSGDYMVGCSPDGVELDGERVKRVIELKCPEPTAHLEYIRTGEMPTGYRAQVIHALWVSGAEVCDWMSYNPDFPPEMQTLLIRVERHDGEIAAYAEKALEFLAEVDNEMCELRERMGV